MTSESEIEPVTEPKAAPASIGGLLGKRVKAAWASFLLGLALFATAFVAFAFWGLAPFSLGTTGAALIGFAVGAFYLGTGFLWALLWSLAVHLNLLVDDLAGWVGDILHQAVSRVRESVSSGDVVEIRLVREQIDRLVEMQSKRLTENKRWGPLVNDYAPAVVRHGLRALLFRFTSRLWPSDVLTIDQIEKGLSRFGGEALVLTTRRILWVAMAGIFLAGAILLGLPLAAAKLIAFVL